MANPLAPTLYDPRVNLAYDFKSYPFLWLFNDPDGGATQSEYSFRRRIATSQIVEYWDRSGAGPTGSWVTTLTWNTSEAPSNQYERALIQSIGGWTTGLYQYSIATKDEGGNVGPWSEWRTIRHESLPQTFLTSHAHTGDINFTRDLISWSYSHPDNKPQQAYRVVFTATGGGSEPGNPMYTGKPIHATQYYDSGIVFSGQPQHLMSGDVDVADAASVRLNVAVWSSYENDIRHSTVADLTMNKSFVMSAPSLVNVGDPIIDGVPKNTITLTAGHTPASFSDVRATIQRKGVNDGSEWKTIYGGSYEEAQYYDIYEQVSDYYIASDVEYEYRARSHGIPTGETQRSIASDWVGGDDTALISGFGWAARDFDDGDNYYCKLKVQSADFNRILNTGEVKLAGRSYALLVTRPQPKGPLEITLDVRVDSRAEEEALMDCIIGKRVWLSSSTGEGWCVGLVDGKYRRRPLVGIATSSEEYSLAYRYLLVLKFIEVDDT